MQYRIGSKPIFKAAFDIQPNDYTGPIYYRGGSEFNLPKTEGSFDCNRSLSYAFGMEAVNTLPTTVMSKEFTQDYYYSLALDFEHLAGTSSHKAYLTLNNAHTERHTVVHTACAGVGGSQEDDVFLNIWWKFCLKNIMKADYSGVLCYWQIASPDTPDTAYGLINMKDGRCGAWADFAMKVFDVHSIGTTLVTWQKKPRLWAYVFDGYGQGMIVPATRYYSSHAMFKRYHTPHRDVDEYIYDPSYGMEFNMFNTYSQNCEDWESVVILEFKDWNGEYISYDPPVYNNLMQKDVIWNPQP